MSLPSGTVTFLFTDIEGLTKLAREHPDKWYDDVSYRLSCNSSANPVKLNQCPPFDFLPKEKIRKNDMSDASLLDPLTGAYTRSTFRESLHVNVEQARRDDTSCSLILFDLDHFKSINDAFGHARGDEVLMEVARRVRETTRDSDLFFRYGGDEFVLLLPNTTKAEAAKLANRLLDSIRAQPLGQEATLNLSISVGVASFPEDTKDENTLFEKTDARNYEAKRRGRACVITEEFSAALELPFAEISRIIEREDALGTAQNFLAAISEQQRGVLSVIGAPGAGSSRFLVEVEKRARLQGFEVITLRSSPRLKNKPYGVLANALSQFFIASPERLNFEELEAALQHQVTTSGCDRMIISVDDMPDVDWGTLDLLRQLLSDSTIPTLGLIYTSDPDHARLVAPFRSPILEHITLRPLSRNGLRIWLRVLMQWEAPEEFIQWLEKQTGGLPHQAELLLRHLLKQGILIKQDSGWRLGENYASVGAEGTRQWQKRVSPNNLPAAFTSFVGRGTELKEVRQLLGTTRLLTVVGSGGMGKTRLTLQVAKEALDGFKDGVWLVELASVADPSLALYTIASALGIDQSQPRPLMDTLSGWLNDKELLLILDNCEHLIDMCAQFAHDVLSTSPNVRILASSREALDIAGELVYRVPALETPDLQTTLPVEQLTRYAAARLFVERAAFALSTFSVSEAEAPLIAQICRQLDGIPLAIELAAARLRTLTLEEIAAGLDDRFSLLTRGNRAAPPRHQTLRSLIDWSYEMLSNAECLLLRRLSVFMGGWTLEAAEAVCDNPNMLDLLTHLVDKSLVAVDLEHGEEPHYYLLETICQYAREKLAEGGENESIRNRHMEYFCQLVERFEPGLRGPNQVILLDGLERELDNLRAALEWSLDHGVSTGLRLVSGLKWFWHLRSHWKEGADWLDKLLRVEAETHSFRSDSESDAFYRAKTLLVVTFLAGVLSEVQKGRVSAAESLAICEKLDRANCASLIAENYLFLGLGALYRGEINQANILAEKSLALYQSSGNKFGVAEVQAVLLSVMALRSGDFETARILSESTLAIRKELGDKDGITFELSNGGVVALCQGDYDRAQNLFRASIDASHEARSDYTLGFSLGYLGAVYLFKGEMDLARDFFLQVAKLAQEKWNPIHKATSIYWLAMYSFEHKQFRKFIQLNSFLESEKSPNIYRNYWPPIIQTTFQRNVAAARAELGQESFNSAEAEGKTMTLDQALAYALEGING